jgi:hypothetical protein
MRRAKPTHDNAELLLPTGETLCVGNWCCPLRDGVLTTINGAEKPLFISFYFPRVKSILFSVLFLERQRNTKAILMLRDLIDPTLLQGEMTLTVSITYRLLTLPPQASYI